VPPIASLLPEGTPGGWARAREPQVFGPDNLWEYIDGAAETYLGFGFEQLAAAGYKRSDDLTANVEIYRTADPRGAFGLFAAESNPTAEFLALGAEAFQNANVLAFWNGPYYVKITASKAGADATAALRALADAASAKTGPPSAPPPEVQWFPTRHLVPHAIRYVPKDVLGQRYLANAFQAQYRDGEATWSLVVPAFETDDASREGLEQYRGFVAKGGTVRSGLARPADGGFAGDDGYYGRVVAIRSGRRLFIALGAPSDTAATGLIAETLKRVGPL
jgi:hypothetical protein